MCETNADIPLTNNGSPIPRTDPINPPLCISLRRAVRLVFFSANLRIVFRYFFNFFLCDTLKLTTPFNIFKQISETAFNTLWLAFFIIFFAAEGLAFASKIKVFCTFLTLGGVLMSVAIFFSYFVIHEIRRGERKRHTRPLAMKAFYKVSNFSSL